MKTEKEKLLKNVDRLKGHKILIVGDVGLDEYVIGNVRRISPEAPVPVLEVSQEDKRLGLSSNVAANVAALGGEAWLVGVIGKDETAESFKKGFRGPDAHQSI
jgi:bifunctional ADP-heptose synthase (sugar kinase/adenylyltransferase)